MITKEMIKNGFKCNVISIEAKCECFGCINICCKIGDNAFYFLGMEDQNLTVKEYWQSYTMDMTIDMLYDILKDIKSAEHNGLDAMEWEYYKALLSYSLKNKNKGESIYDSRT